MNKVLVSQEIRELVDNKVINAHEQIEEKQIQPASIDLRLSNDAYEIKESFLPKRGETLEQVLRREKVRKFSLDKEPELMKGKVYLVKLQEHLSFLPNQEAKANPKSSTGRIDLFVRLVVDGYPIFDRIPKGYEGSLYSIIIPQSFNVLAYPGVSLSQLRIFEGSPQLNNHELHLALRRHKLIAYGSGLIKLNEVTIDNGIYLSVGINKGKVAYRSKKTNKFIDLSKEDHHEVSEFWDIVESKDGKINLEPGFFYLLSTRENVRIPPHLAAELEAVNVIFGDFRSHYAGFFDPGFGYGDKGDINGTRVTLEVRPIEHKFRLNDSQFICRLVYEKTSQQPDKIYGAKTGSHYLKQSGLTHAKYFKKH